MRPRTYSKEKTPIFIQKLYQIICDEDNRPIIDWTKWGDSFIILNLKQFTSSVLPKYFKHSNYNSFIRQLNMYNFNKIRQDGRQGSADHIYQNDKFLKDNPSTLKEIRRKEIVGKSQQGGLSVRTEVYASENEESLQDKLKNVKVKQEKLTEMCASLIHQNKILVAHNQELVKHIKKESKKKDRILNQFFRIIGSISQQWEDFITETSPFIDDEVNQKKKYIQMLMNFIDKNELPTILKTMKKFFNFADVKKSKNFTIIPQSGQAVEGKDILGLQPDVRVENGYLEEMIQLFREASLILQNSQQ